jgi:hypothetical protein
MNTQIKGTVTDANSSTEPKLPTVCRNKTQREAAVSINILDYLGQNTITTDTLSDRSKTPLLYMYIIRTSGLPSLLANRAA